MARARNIKPGFFVNEQLVELPFETRLLFAGLWTIADREGRLEDRPKKIKMAIFPADDVDVNESLQQLHDAGLIVRYVVEDKGYIEVLKFVQHQNPHVKEATSVIPAPDNHGATSMLATPLTSSLIPESLVVDATASATDTTFEPERFNHPAVIEFESVFGFTPGSGFATSVCRKVTNLAIWTSLLDNKRSFADKPLKERKKVCNWILDAYDERVTAAPKITKLPSPAELIAAEAADRHLGLIQPPTAQGGSA